IAVTRPVSSVRLTIEVCARLPASVKRKNQFAGRPLQWASLWSRSPHSITDFASARPPEPRYSRHHSLLVPVVLIITANIDQRRVGRGKRKEASGLMLSFGAER